MGILIEVHTDTMGPQEWNALAAFVVAMGGKAEGLASTTSHKAIIAADPTVPAAPVADAGDPPSDGNIAGDASQEADGPEVSGALVTGLTPVVVPEGVELDVRGLPWDSRIHASTKTKKQNGEWTARRNTDAALIAQVEEELKRTMAAPAATPAIQAEGTPAAPAAPPPPSGTPAIQAEGSPAPAAPPPPATGNPPVVAEGSPAAAPPPPVEAAAGDTPFTLFMRKVVAKQSAGTVTTAMTNEIAASLGLASIRDLSSRPDLIPAFEALLP